MVDGANKVVAKNATGLHSSPFGISRSRSSVETCCLNGRPIPTRHPSCRLRDGRCECRFSPPGGFIFLHKQFVLFFLEKKSKKTPGAKISSFSAAGCKKRLQIAGHALVVQHGQFGGRNICQDFGLREKCRQVIKGKRCQTFIFCIILLAVAVYYILYIYIYIDCIYKILCVTVVYCILL